MTNEIKVGGAVKVNGREYTITANLGIGENVARVCPWIAGQYGITGKRGAVALMQVYRTGSVKLVFTTAARVETDLNPAFS